uniref:Protection of telomeres protein 1 n=1 Tax=Sinocyclocheilus rhinocerous TaxID=307959 RepID=A0A673HMZ8_9TELE
MPVQKVNDSSDLDAKVPSHLHHSLLVSSHSVLAVFFLSFSEEDPLQRTAEHTSINVIFFGTLAKDFSQSARQGDVVLLADFTIKKSPSFLRDKLHPCQLEMDGKDDCVYVLFATIAVVKAKYTYVPLNNLKPKTVVNVYGVVTFFKQPFPSKGSDYCSTLKITDQSDVKVGCNIFSKKLEDHPVIFRVGDIIRLHRFKTEMFRDSMSLLNTYGWSTVTFDGTIDSPVVPHTSSKSFHFGESDIRTVQELRQWAANQSWISNDLTVSLSSVKPGMYFDLTCQLLAKAIMDSRCILLKVWDGTKCQHPLLNVAVASDALEGESTVAKDRMNLTANVLVYDNHLEVARDLKPGTFLCFYNLHALLQRAPDQLPDQLEHLSFHLHGGTSYGRGLRSLPAESPALQSLKSVLEKHVDLDEYDEVNDGTLLEIWYTPPEAVGWWRLFWFPISVQFLQTCEHNMRRLTLARVKRSTPPLLCHVQARVKKYNPQQLYQCLKLFCSNCKTMEDVPDDSAVAKVFRESAKDSQPCDEQWAATSSASSREPGRAISMHISRDMVGESTHMQLIFVEGTTLDEICVLSRDYKNLVPVRSVNGRMTLMDLTAPFLFSGDKRYYGCKQCSLNTFQNPVFAGVETWDEQAVAEALGVRLMQYRLLMQFELEDQTDTLEALLWENAERFFHVSAVDASGSQDLQDKIQTIMDTIQPPDSSLEERPWLDLCVSVYTVKDNDRNKVCYQITNTEIKEE